MADRAGAACAIAPPQYRTSTAFARVAASSVASITASGRSANSSNWRGAVPPSVAVSAYAHGAQVARERRARGLEQRAQRALGGVALADVRGAER